MTRQPDRSDLDALQQRIGYTFANAQILRRALTHASANQGAGGKAGRSTYQRLEFLGDRVLGLVIADLLVTQFPDAAEGELSRRLARLVSGETCAAVGRELGLEHHMIVDSNVLRSGGKAADGIHADICESIIGALYRDGGLAAAHRFIERLWQNRILSMTGPLRDAKTELQEWAHRQELPTPTYREVSRSGPDHAPTFEVEVMIDSIENERSSGRSKRDAEHKAAEALLRREGVWVDP